MSKKSFTDKLKALDQVYDAPATIVEYKTLLTWKDGIPYVAGKPFQVSQSAKERLLALMETSLSLPYDGKDPSLAGLTMEEALIINLTRDAARGDHEARMAILDRLLGRPKQSIESLQLTGDLNSFLDKVAAETKEHIIEVEAEVTNNNSAEDL